jgi:hypothetical protein
MILAAATQFPAHSFRLEFLIFRRGQRLTQASFAVLPRLVNMTLTPGMSAPVLFDSSSNESPALDCYKKAAEAAHDFPNCEDDDDGKEGTADQSKSEREATSRAEAECGDEEEGNDDAGKSGEGKPRPRKNRSRLAEWKKRKCTRPQVLAMSRV